MKRRDFLKILAAAPMVAALPVLLKVNPVVADVAFSPLGVDKLTLWASAENTTEMADGRIRWNDMSGNGNHLYGNMRPDNII